MVINEIHGNVLMRMLSVTYNTHTQAELYIDACTSFTFFCPPELVISLNKRGQRLMESQNGNICVSFSTVFAVNFSINIISLLPSNITIPDVGMYVRTYVRIN